ncbi:MAG TPA: phosphoglycerate kinase [Verrucomicrobiae bacterium]|jgi:3-phosphoglycerate kinase|nr:phosphoglycerate kinase [Verrucomicrobiae bacterium]
MFSKKTIRDIDLKGKTVLLRADYNVPVSDGKITDDYRIEQSLPTIHYLLERNVRLIICSHLGRPDGSNNPALSLFPVAKRLQQLLDRPVEFATDCVGPAAKKAASGLPAGHVLLLENLRFHPEEKANDDGFAKQLASLADVYVNDAFAVDHRADASLEAITHHLPSVAGLLLEKEVDMITKVMEQPERPLMAIIGGAKIADKIDILHRFIEIADFVAVGGAMANTFLAAQGVDIGDSLYDKVDLPVAKDILRKADAEAKKRRFIFAIPHDGVIAHKIDKTAPTRIVDWSTHVISDVENYPKRVPASASHIHAHEMILDIGPFSGSFIAGGVQLANTVVWNGAMGVTETAGLQGPIGPYAHGTELVIEALLGEFGHKPFTLVGGGDTIGYVESRKLVSRFDHVSTGGGASLELMGGRKLPGVEALLDKK